MAAKKVEQKIEEALLALAAEVPFVDIRLGDIATRAGVDLAELRKAFDGPFAILASFARRIDVAVLASEDPSVAGESRRDRLFDALMRRFDLLAGHRAGLAGLQKAARRDPVLACHLLRLSVGSQTWMLEAAGISTAGLFGRLRAPVLALALARLLPIYLADEEEGLPKTMAALDETLKQLGRLEKRTGWVKDLACAVRRRTPEPAAPAEAGSDAA